MALYSYCSLGGNTDNWLCFSRIHSRGGASSSRRFWDQLSAPHQGLQDLQLTLPVRPSWGHTLPAGTEVCPSPSHASCSRSFAFDFASPGALLWHSPRSPNSFSDLQGGWLPTGFMSQNPWSRHHLSLPFVSGEVLPLMGLCSTCVL